MQVSAQAICFILCSARVHLDVLVWVGARCFSLARIALTVTRVQSAYATKETCNSTRRPTGTVNYRYRVPS
jgi:hypothetical protein